MNFNYFYREDIENFPHGVEYYVENGYEYLTESSYRNLYQLYNQMRDETHHHLKERMYADPVFNRLEDDGIPFTSSIDGEFALQQEHEHTLLTYRAILSVRFKTVKDVTYFRLIGER